MAIYTSNEWLYITLLHNVARSYILEKSFWIFLPHYVSIKCLTLVELLNFHVYFYSELITWPSVLFKHLHWQWNLTISLAGMNICSWGMKFKDLSHFVKTFHRIHQSMRYILLCSMKLVILLNSLCLSIHSKDESKRSTACAFIFGVHWLWRCDVTASFGVFFWWIRM